MRLSPAGARRPSGGRDLRQSVLQAPGPQILRVLPYWLSHRIPADKIWRFPCQTGQEPVQQVQAARRLRMPFRQEYLKSGTGTASRLPGTPSPSATPLRRKKRPPDRPWRPCPGAVLCPEHAGEGRSAAFAAQILTRRSWRKPTGDSGCGPWSPGTWKNGGLHRRRRPCRLRGSSVYGSGPPQSSFDAPHFFSPGSCTLGSIQTTAAISSPIFPFRPVQRPAVQSGSFQRERPPFPLCA